MSDDTVQKFSCPGAEGFCNSGFTDLYLQYKDMKWGYEITKNIFEYLSRPICVSCSIYSENWTSAGQSGVVLVVTASNKRNSTARDRFSRSAEAQDVCKCLPTEFSALCNLMTLSFVCAICCGLIIQ
jgi:hypothetical protein